MKSINPNYPAPVKKDRRHLALSREDPAQELGSELCHRQSLGKRPGEAFQAGPGRVGGVLCADAEGWPVGPVGVVTRFSDAIFTVRAVE